MTEVQHEVDKLRQGPVLIIGAGMVSLGSYRLPRLRFVIHNLDFLVLVYRLA